MSKGDQDPDETILFIKISVLLESDFLGHPLEFVQSASLLQFWFQWQNQSLLSTQSGSVWVLALALVSLKLEIEPRFEVVLKTNQFW